jgi:hypothetical protein
LHAQNGIASSEIRWSSVSQHISDKASEGAMRRLDIHTRYSRGGERLTRITMEGKDLLDNPCILQTLQ